MTEYDNMNGEQSLSGISESSQGANHASQHGTNTQSAFVPTFGQEGVAQPTRPMEPYVTTQQGVAAVSDATSRLPRNEVPVSSDSASAYGAPYHVSPEAQYAAAGNPAHVSTDARTVPTFNQNTYAQRPYGTQAQASTSTGPSATQTFRRSSSSAGGATRAKKKHGGLKTFLLGFLGAALAFVLLSALTNTWGAPAKQNTENTAENKPAPTLGATTNTTIAAGDDDEGRAELVAEKVLPSIAAIDTYASQGNFGSFWGYGAPSSGGNSLQALGLGSGVVVSSDGYILTNYHVVEGAEKVMVTVEGQEYEGQVAGTDPASDLAVIKVDAPEGLAAIEIGSSSDLRPGQWVMTLGSPFGLEQSVATGIVSAVSRTVVMGSSDYSYGGQSEATSIYANMIQTDAAINPGNSGGALVDENGKLIGINSVIESYSGSYSGVGFAIPVDYAMNIAQQIIDGKVPTHAQLGVATTTIDSSLAERYKLGADKGAYISKVYDNSGASEAGLEVGDVITKLGDAVIETSSDVVAAVRAHNVGDTVSLTYVRDGQENTVDVVLGSDENVTSTADQEDERIKELYEYFGYNGDGSSDPYGDPHSDPYGGGSEGDGFNYNLDELLDYFGYGSPGGSTQYDNAA